MSERASLAAVLVRYGLAGLLNTSVGFAVILLLEFGLGLDARLANAGGFAAGLLCAFVLNRSFVFMHKGRAGAAAARFALAAAGSFLVNQAVLWIAGAKLRTVVGGPVLAQGLAIASYNVTLFLASRLWVFAADAEI